MQRERIISVRVDDAFLTERHAHLECRPESGPSIPLSIPFNDRAAKGSDPHNRWLLVVKLAEWHGMTMFDVTTTNLRCIIGKHYKFRLKEWRADYWVIDAGKAIEPFEIADPESDDAVAEFERAMGIA